MNDCVQSNAPEKDWVGRLLRPFRVMNSATLTPEQRLLLHILPGGIAAAGGASAPALDAALVAAVPDADGLAALAAAHRVTPLVYLGGGGALRARLAAPMARVRARNLRLADATRRALLTLAAAGIDAVALKGLTLAERAYGSLFAREVRDLDLLVAPDRLDAARAALMADGYRWLERDFSPRAARSYRRRKTHFTLHDDAHGVHLELHWALLRAPDLAGRRLAEMWERSTPGSFMGAPLRQLAPDDELLMLLLHGSKHGWSDLIWLCDVVAWLRRAPAVDWDALYGRARALRAERFIALGVLMVGALLSVPLPAVAVRPAEQMPGMAALTAAFCADYFGARPPPGALTPDAFRLQMRLRRGAADRIGFIRYQLDAWQPSPRDRAFLKLPPRLHFLYPLVRPLRMAVQYGRGVFGRG